MKLEIRHLFHSHLRKIADLNSLENPSDIWNQYVTLDIALPATSTPFFTPWYDVGVFKNTLTSYHKGNFGSIHKLYNIRFMYGPNFTRSRTPFQVSDNKLTH